MPRLVPIVEGDGETTAVPLLLRRILYRLERYDIQVSQAKNANGRGNLTKPGGLERFIRYAWRERDCGAIFVLIDAEDDCPVELAREFSRRVEAIGIIFPVVIVVAKRMYEAWLIASITTIAGRLDLPANIVPPTNAEAVPNPKKWIEEHFPPGRAYKETQDQDAMTNLMDLGLASSTRSFRRMLKAVDEALEAIDSESQIVTPHFDD